MVERERAAVYKKSRGTDVKRVVGFDDAVLGVEKVLAKGETPRAAVWGQFENGRFGLLVATDVRLIGFNKGVFSGSVNVEEIPFDMISSISDKISWVSGEITISTFSGGLRNVKNLNKEATRVFSGWVRSKIGSTNNVGNSRGQQTTTASLSVPSLSFAEEIAKLTTLRDSGALTQEEFVEAKKRILK